MSSSKIESRIEKNIKRRITRSPLGSTAAETLLLLTKQLDKVDSEIHLASVNTITTRRNNSEMLKKSFKRTQSSDYIKIITEKNQEIKKLQEDNHLLSSQLTELSSMVKKYQKMRCLVKEKDFTIDNLKSSIEKLKVTNVILDKEDIKRQRRSSRQLIKNGSKIHSRLSLDSEVNTYDWSTSRPLTVAHKGPSIHESPYRVDMEKKLSPLPSEMKSLISRTDKILKGWKKAYKHKKKTNNL